MDKKKVVNLANKGLEMVSEMSVDNKYKNLLGNLFFEMRKEAINYTRCCETLSKNGETKKKKRIIPNTQPCERTTVD